MEEGSNLQKDPQIVFEVTMHDKLFLINKAPFLHKAVAGRIFLG